MKKQIILLAMMLLPMVVGAQGVVEIDGICYELVSKIKEATVTKKTSGEYTGNVVIPDSVTYNGAEYSVISIKERAFENSSVTSVMIGNSVTSIGSDAFYNCSGLTSVTIPNSMEKIGFEAFCYCYGLTSVHISDIAAWCKILFMYADWSDFSSNPLCHAHHLYLDEEEIKDLVIPNSVTSIGNYAFSGCSGLTSVTIPNSVTSIGNSVFSGCRGLTSITIPNSIMSIGEGVFKNCSGLTYVTIGNSLTRIENYAFYNCSALTSVTIPNSVTSIGSYAFRGCSSLTSITIPNSVTSIGGYAFYNCRGLTSVTIPNSVTSIGEEAFYECSGLTSVTIGSGVTFIGQLAFASCKELMDVYCLAEKVPRAYTTSAFQDSYIEYATLHVPAASINDYKAVEPWKNFKKIVAIDEKPVGDVNGDNVIDVADIGTIIDVMAAGDKVVEQVIAADVNKDGIVDVADIAAIIDIMAGK